MRSDRLGYLVAFVTCILTACAAPPPIPVVSAKVDRIVLLPQADGSSSALLVRSTGGAEALLSQPYAMASVTSGSIQASRTTADEVRNRYAALNEALPPQRKSFVLYFETGGDRFTTESAVRLDEILGEVAKMPAPEVMVVGHTDSAGSDTINDELSLQRARIVRSRLVERGIDSRRIEAVGRGKREPLVSTRAGVAEPRNRRVEIQVR